MNTEERHWTQNPELIERFVLQQMNPAERNELEDHLRVCEVCKRAVRDEHVLIAGIRRTGREQFKQDLKNKVTALPDEERSVPWGRILSAAAVILILLSAGIYNRWFETTKDEDATTPSPRTLVLQEDESTTGDSKIDAPSEVSVPGETPAPTPLRNLEKEIRKAASSPRQSARPPSTPQSDVVGDRPELPRAQQEVSRLAGETISTQTELSTIAGRTTGELWVKGTIIHETTSHGVKPDLYNRIYQSKSADETRRGSTTRESRRKGNTGAPGTDVLIVQRSSQLLPAEQQGTRQRDASSHVITQLVQTDNETHIIVFLDSLMSDEELANATLETPAVDSLILHFSTRRIAYKIPTAWNTRFRQMEPK